MPDKRKQIKRSNLVDKHFNKPDSSKIDKLESLQYEEVIQNLKNKRQWNDEYKNELLKLKKLVYENIPPVKEGKTSSKNVSFISKL